MPPTMLASSEEARGLRGLAERLARLLLPREKMAAASLDRAGRMAVARVRYGLRTLYGLPARLSLGDENNPLYAVDIECVEVLEASRIPGTERLWVTRARGALGYTIVTNLPDVRRGEVRAAAVLPPAEIGGVVSEAMYCSGPLEGCRPGARPPGSAVDRGAVEAEVVRIASRVR